MSRRHFLKTSALIGATGLALKLTPTRAQRVAPSSATGRPIQIRMGGYAPPTTSFSLGLKLIGDRLEEEFGDELSIRYTYNVMDVGYGGGGDLRWLVDSGLLTVGYVTMTDVPELELAALPFLFSDTTAARAAMDGPLGQSATTSLEAANNYRILGYFENGFRHISNNIRPVDKLEDLQGLKIRVLGVQARTFELLGADPQAINLSEAIQRIQAGTLDGQENPFANTVTYNIYPYQRFHTTTFHSYLSRPIFIHQPSFDTWPKEIQTGIRHAAQDAVTLQRELHDREEEEAQTIIREAGGEITELTPEAREEFVAAVAPIYTEAQNRYSRELLEMVNLQ
jgi:TRAP-type C4-dicarboxylate transport system substrate-binding protein